MRDLWRSYRDRLLASPAFRRWATRFPLTRPIARRRARALFDLCAGFVYAQVLHACVRLRLFETLAAGPLALPTLADRLALPPESARRLLDAAAALRLVEPRGGDRFGLGPLGAAMIGNPGIAAMVTHHAALYADLADPVALLRGSTGSGALAGYWPYAAAADPAALPAEQVADYTALMAASQPLVAAEVLDAYPPRRHRLLLDVGGGDGSFLVAAGARAATPRLLLFDLPAVAARARARFADAGLAGRADAVGGDFARDPLPSGADLISLIRVVHDHDDNRARALLRACRTALSPGGRLLLAEPMAGTPGAEPAGAAYFGFYLLAMGSGRPRSAETLTAMLREAGFRRIRAIPTATPLLVRVLVAST